MCGPSALCTLIVERIIPSLSHWESIEEEGTVRKFSLFLAALTGTTAALPAISQERDVLGLDVGAALDVRSVDNAGQQPDSEEQVSEIETIASLYANGELKGAWAEFQTNYRLEDRRYSEFSDENERLILGDSRLILGPQHRRYYLELSHSSRELAIDPLSIDRPSNRENRQLLSAALYGTLMPGKGNTVTVWGSATDIQFDESPEYESERAGLGLEYRRSISAVSQVGLELSGYQLRYREQEDSDVTYYRVATLWRTDLRHLGYGFQFGGNTIETERDTSSSPFISADLSFSAGVWRLDASYHQFLSDTSQGAQETTTMLPAVEFDGRLDGVLDQYKVQQFRVLWTHAQVCRSCSLRLDVAYDQEIYLNTYEYDMREIRIGGLFDYRATPSTVLSFRLQLTDFEEVNTLPRNGYEEINAEFRIGFPRLVKDGDLSFFVGGVDRDFNQSEGYDYSYIGARFSYNLYHR